MVFINRPGSAWQSNGFGLSVKTSAQSRMTRHLLFPVLINASDKSSTIAF